MGKKVILHLGTHKTGTSYLQHALNLYQHDFSDIAYFSVHSEYRETHLNFRQKFNVLRNAFLTRRADNAAQAIQTEAFLDAQKYIRQIIDNTQKKIIFISDENWLGVPMGQIMPGGSYMEYNFYPQRKNIALCLKEIFSPYELKVLLYSRQKKQLVESLYSNALMNLSFPGSLKDFKQQMNLSSIDFEKLHNDLNKSFGSEISILEYETLKKSNAQFAKEFYKITTLKISKKYWSQTTINSRLPDRHVKTARELAKQKVTPELQNKFRRYLETSPTNATDTFKLTTST